MIAVIKIIATLDLNFIGIISLNCRNHPLKHREVKSLIQQLSSSRVWR